MEGERRRFDRVLVATDLGPSGRAALSRAAGLPLAPGARVAVVHVLPPGLPAPLLERGTEAARAALAREIRSAGRGRRGSRDPLVPAIRSGRPAEEILEAARRHRAELVVLGRGSRPHGLLGSIAARVLRRSPVPVLVVGGEGRARWQRVIAGIDPEEPATPILDLAGRLVPARARRIALHACGAPFLGFALPALEDAEVAAWRRDAERAGLLALRGAIAHAGATGWSARVRWGEAAGVLLHEARARAVLLVVGTHGRSRLGRLLLGSVAERVLEAAGGDVAVVPTAQAGRVAPKRTAIPAR